MKQLFDISLFHEYDRGKSPHLNLIPLNYLKSWMRKDRLRLKKMSGGLSFFIEDDLALLDECTHLCFWLVFEHDDFLYYSEYEDQLLFDQPRYQWMQVEEKESYIALQTEPLDQAVAQQWIKEGEQAPRKTLGLVAIPCAQIQVGNQYRIQFNSKKTYWEYRVHSDDDLKDWRLSLRDKDEQWVFDQQQVGGEWRFRSQTPLPYFKKATNRLVLKWEPQENSFQFQSHKINLPFPNYRYRSQESNINISPVYIKL